MPRTGRQPKLTPAIQERICHAVQAGVGVLQAASLAGIGHSTVMAWLHEGDGPSGRRPKPIYQEFREAITRAKAQDEARRILRINQAGQGGTVLHEKTTAYANGRQVVERHYSAPDWRADAYHLEKAYAERWGWKARLEVDLQVRIRQMAEDVGRELSLSADEILAEAQRYLHESERRRLR
jgi:hypothetical protein